MDEKKHLMALYKFFNKQRKLHKNELDKRMRIREPMNKNKKYNKKKLALLVKGLKKTREYNYNVYLDRYVIERKDNNQEIVTVKRLPKKSYKEWLHKYNNEMEEIGKLLLNIKYSYLFEYKEIQDYENEYISTIEPKEKRYEIIEKKIEKINQKKNEFSLNKEKKLDELKLQYNNIQEELKSFELEDSKEKKRMVFEEYINKQKELFDLKIKDELSLEYSHKDNINNELSDDDESLVNVLDIEELSS